MLRRIAKRVIPSGAREWAKKSLTRAALGYDFATPGFSTGGEDALLNYLFAFRSEGFFVDVGAYHPTQSSNTYLFYLKGWRGINIDARPDSMALFDRVRPRDINLVRAISTDHETLSYNEMGADASMNTFSGEFIERLATGRQVVARQSMETVPLAAVLAEHLPTGQAIDFFSIDVEGLELRVLASNDWTRFRPAFVLLESFAPLDEELFESEVVRFMGECGYRMILKTTTEMGFVADERSLSPVGQIEGVKR